jgi:hypothetical protein
MEKSSKSTQERLVVLEKQNRDLVKQLKAAKKDE